MKHKMQMEAFGNRKVDISVFYYLASQVSDATTA